MSASSYVFSHLSETFNSLLYFYFSVHWIAEVFLREVDELSVTFAMPQYFKFVACFVDSLLSPLIRKLSSEFLVLVREHYQYCQLAKRV